MNGQEDLIKQCINGNLAAQKQLYNTYSAKLYGLCLRYSQDQTEAEDVLQEAFLKIMLNLKEYNGTGSFEGWMKRIAINTAITNYHKNLKHRFHYDIDEMYDLPAEDVNFDSADFTRDELLSIINHMPQGYKMVFNLYAVEGFKHREIAEMLGIDINTSKTQFLRARKYIIKELENLKKNGGKEYE